MFCMVTRAPAKVNFSLFIRHRREDGYHELESFVVFAGSSDYLGFSPVQDLPEDGITLTLSGPKASHLPAGRENLVLRAVHHLAKRLPGLCLGHFHLRKYLPITAGIGGGSADAAAALSLVAQVNRLPLSHPEVQSAAQATGADVPVCLAVQPRMMRGIGDKLAPEVLLPPFYILLMNPSIPLEVTRVFAALGLAKGQVHRASPHPNLPSAPTESLWLELFHQTANDLEAPACRYLPVIGQILTDLRHLPGCLGARMSGSGATCYALFHDREKMHEGVDVMQKLYPQGWVEGSSLKGGRRILHFNR